MTIPTRLYVVEHTDAPFKPPRLIRATLRSHAERFVCAGMVRSRIASKDDIERMLSQGIRTELAADPSPEPEAA